MANLRNMIATGFAALFGLFAQIIIANADSGFGPAITGDTIQAVDNVFTQKYIYNGVTDPDVLTQFGAMRFLIASQGNNNGLVVGILQNSGTFGFPTSITGYGKLNSSISNQVFPLFGQCDQYTMGVCSHELDIALYTGVDAPSTYPFDHSSTTTQFVSYGLNSACIGGRATTTFQRCGAAFQGIAQQYGQWQFGYTLDKKATNIAGLYFDADATNGPLTGAYIKSPGTNGYLASIWQTMGTRVNKNPVIQIQDPSGNVRFQTDQSGCITTSPGLKGSRTFTTYNGCSFFETTSDATPTTLSLDGLPGTGCCITLPNNTTGGFFIVAEAINTSTRDMAMFICGNVAISNKSGTVALVGVPTCTQSQADAGMAATTLTISADNTNKQLNVIGTGIAATNIDWNATLVGSLIQ